jgi:hypothetical protein
MNRRLAVFVLLIVLIIILIVAIVGVSRRQCVGEAIADARDHVGSRWLMSIRTSG